jgi:hypothetical protein
MAVRPSAPVNARQTLIDRLTQVGDLSRRDIHLLFTRNATGGQIDSLIEQLVGEGFADTYQVDSVTKPVTIVSVRDIT